MLLHVVEFLFVVSAHFNVAFYFEYHRTAVSEVFQGKKWSVNPFQTLKVQEMEYTYSSTNFRDYQKKNNLGKFTKSAHDCFMLMFWNEHQSNFFFAWHVIESHFKEELSLIFLAKKFIWTGEKFVPQTACLSSEVNKCTAELSFGSSRNILSWRAQMSTEICIKLFTRTT